MIEGTNEGSDEAQVRVSLQLMHTCLPVELSSKIFIYVSKSHEGRLSRGGYRQKGWLMLSEVCRAWRDIVLGTSVLWAEDICQLPCSPTLSFERAGTAPLTILIKYDQSHAMLSFVFRSDVIARARRLTVSSNFGYIATKVAPNFPFYDKLFSVLCEKSLPMLEELFVTEEDHSSSQSSDALAMHTLGGSRQPFIAKQLQRVMMYGVFIPWSTSTSSISSLCMGMFPTPTSDSLDLLLSILDLLPLLEILSLSRVLPDLPDPLLTHRRRPVSLPRLRNLRMEQYSSLPVAALLGALNIPPSAILGLWIWGWIQNRDRGPRAPMHRALRMLVASVGRILHDADSSEAGPFVGMSIKSRWTSYDMSHGNIDEGNITFWLPKPTTGCAGDALKPFGKEFDTDFHVSVNSKIHTSLEFPDHDSDEGPTCIRVLKVLDEFYPLSAIEAIRIDFRQPFAYKDWVSFLKRMPNVRRLYVHGDYEGNTCSLWSVLGRSVASDTSGSTDNVLFPCLSSIFIDTRETQGSSPFWLALLGMLFRRAKAGNAVQFLRIDASWDNAEPLKKCQIQRLKDFVSSFEYEIHNWDVDEDTESSAYSFSLSREWDDSNAFEARLPPLSLDSDVEALSSDGEWSDGGDDDDGDGDSE